MRRKNNRIKQDILFVLTSSFIVVVAWIGFNIYHIWVTSTIDEQVQAQLDPIDPNFDTTILQKIESRTKVDPSFSKTVVEPTETPQASAAAQQTQTVSTASQSGNQNQEIPTIVGQ